MNDIGEGISSAEGIAIVPFPPQNLIVILSDGVVISWDTSLSDGGYLL